MAAKASATASVRRGATDELWPSREMRFNMVWLLYDLGGVCVFAAGRRSTMARV
jgi:hypothetical protein